MRPMLHLLERMVSDSESDGHIIETYKSVRDVKGIVLRGTLILTFTEPMNLMASYERFLLH